MSTLKKVVAGYQYSPGQQRWVLEATKDKALALGQTDVIPALDEALKVVKDGQAVQRRWELQKGAQPDGRDAVEVAEEIDAIVGGIDGTLEANGRRRLADRGRQALVLRRALLPMGRAYVVGATHVEKATRAQDLVTALRDPTNADAVRSFGIAAVADELEPLLARFSHLVMPVMPVTWDEVVAALELGHDAMLRVICLVAGRFDVGDAEAVATRDALLLPFLDMEERVRRVHVERRNRKTRRDAKARAEAEAAAARAVGAPGPVLVEG